ncbi:MAG: glycosyltransferase [Hydrococcus sp. Prado102]|jgi:glycosyltransferase involved in cell wall biosynthesis|nr:glycosyltransferase [Hydrococcus sp. Prado102]
MLSKTRIGLRVFYNTAWMGGINYVISWVRAFHLLPEAERPIVYLLYTNEASLAIAQEYASLVTDLRPFSEACQLNLDLVYPATQIFEAPFEAPWAGWIPDWQCKHLPEMFDELELARRDLHYRLLATEAPFLVLSSQMACEDTVKIVGDRIVPSAKLHFPAAIDDRVWQWSEAEIAEPLERFRLPKRFFLVCNQFWKHKNHTVVFEALARLADESIACVFTGETKDPRWAGYFKEIEDYIVQNRLSSSVYLLGRISRDDQLKLMRNAIAIVQPSRFEGWSSVVEEARAMDKVLLLSDFPVHREQAPTKSYFFNPDDAQELAQLMLKIWSEESEIPKQEALPILQARQHDYVLDCARQLLAIAGQTLANYDLELHDPKKILLNLFVELSDRDRTSIQEQIYQRITAGIRSMLKTEPKQLVKFTILAADRFPEHLEAIKQTIVLPTLNKMSAEDRDLYYLEIADTNSKYLLSSPKKTSKSNWIQKVMRKIPFSYRS